MRSLRKFRLPAALLGGALLLAPVTAVRADEAPQGDAPTESPGALAREGLEQMMQALRLLVESIPQYELPEVLENGDIIIRRKRPEPESEDPEFDETAT
jgi:hypothetical protein